MSQNNQSRTKKRPYSFLKVVGGLTSEAFLLINKKIKSANKELLSEWNQAKLEFKVQTADTLALESTQWHLSPAYCSDFGRLREAGVN